jgi:hypothetical protein
MLAVMRETPHQRFANVQMPKWYRISAWIVRAVAFLILVVSAWVMKHQDATGSSWPIAGVIIGVLLLVLPSLPKAYIEQRNRIRGARDGSFQEFLKDEQRNDS